MKLQIDELGFVGINVEDWDINRSYRKPTITTDYNTWITYITRKNVPAGIPLTDNEYWKPILKESGLENITRRLDELERKVAYYHPEGVTITVFPQTAYVGQRKQISITASLTVPANRITLYRNNNAIYQVEDSTSLEYQDIVVPATTDNIVYRVVAVIGSETMTNEATVSVKGGLTVKVGHGVTYDDAVFTDTTMDLSDNMPVTSDNNAGDYIFIKVGKDETVNNLYIHNEGAGIFEYMEIALDEPQVVGDYKYYKSTNRYNADTAVPYIINKV